MADYKETTLEGTAYTRCDSVLLSNPKDGLPGVAFHEQRYYNLDGEVVVRDMGSLPVSYDPAGVIQLRNPATGELVGQTMSHDVLYAAMYSLYIQSALARDAV